MSIKDNYVIKKFRAIAISMISLCQSRANRFARTCNFTPGNDRIARPADSAIDWPFGRSPWQKGIVPDFICYSEVVAMSREVLVNWLQGIAAGFFQNSCLEFSDSWGGVNWVSASQRKGSWLQGESQS